MTSRSIRRATLLTLITVTCAITAAHLAYGGKPKPAPAPYAITELDGFSGSTFSAAYKINDLSPNGIVTIAGLSSGGSQSAAIWEASATGNILSLETVPIPTDANFSHAVDVNNSGFVLGYWGNNSNVLVSASAAFVDIPVIGPIVLSSGSSYAVPQSINNNGVVVDKEGVLRQVTPNGTVSTLGYLDYSFDPWDINDQDVVAGNLNFQPAIAWLDANLVSHSQTLPVLPGCTGGAALAINNNNQVVGYCNKPNGSTALYLAFIWDPVAGVTAIGDLGGNFALALDINDHGQVVGVGLPKGGKVGHAFLWQNGTLSDLNTLAAAGTARTLQRADGINNDGRIVGTMILNATGEDYGFLLTPTP
jgi:probable HAF family extracellular repeat protein